MILYNITLGNLNLAPEPWSHTMDDHGNHFITKDDIRQRIRITGKISLNGLHQMCSVITFFQTLVG